MDDTERLNKLRKDIGLLEWQIRDIEQLIKQDREATIKVSSVGKVADAEIASKHCYAKTKQEAFMQGFRYARNRLQDHKSELLTPTNSEPDHE